MPLDSLYLLKLLDSLISFLQIKISLTIKQKAKINKDNPIKPLETNI